MSSQEFALAVLLIAWIVVMNILAILVNLGTQLIRDHVYNVIQTVLHVIHRLPTVRNAHSPSTFIIINVHLLLVHQDTL